MDPLVMNTHAHTCKQCGAGIIDCPLVYLCWYFCSQRCYDRYVAWREGKVA